MKNSMEVPQKSKNRTAIWSSNSTPGCVCVCVYIYVYIYIYIYVYIYIYISKGKKIPIWKDICIVTLFTIVKIWKQPMCPSTDEWIKMWYIHIYVRVMEYYPAIKKNEILPLAATWMDLEGIMLSEVRQRKTNTVCFHLHVESKK